MKKHQSEPMNPSLQFCPNESCLARGKLGKGNIRIHDRIRQRYRCRECKATFSARRGTMLEGLRKPTEIIIIVVTLLAYGCPVQAIVHAYDLDERTVASWRDRAGSHCQQVHRAMIEQGNLDLVHVQADEIRVKGRSWIAWMGFSMMISTRLWLGGVVSLRRDTALADRMMAKVRACSQTTCALLVCTDGWAAYPKSICRAFRDTRQRDRRTGTLLLAGVVPVVYRDGNQASRKETGGGSHQEDDMWNLGASHPIVEGITRRKHAQHGLY